MAIRFRANLKGDRALSLPVYQAAILSQWCAISQDQPANIERKGHLADNCTNERTNARNALSNRPQVGDSQPAAKTRR